MCYDTINKQQTFLEMLDAEKRSNNVVLFSVKEPENENQEENDEEVKIKEVFEKIEVHTLPKSYKRLGQRGVKPRPILVTLESGNARRDVLKNAKKLKEVNEYKRIFIRKDQHPAIRREYGRLRMVEKSEKEKPQNQGVNIVFHKDDRTLRRNGIVIDRFNLNFA